MQVDESRQRDQAGRVDDAGPGAADAAADLGDAAVLDEDVGGLAALDRGPLDEERLRLGHFVSSLLRSPASSR
ncbi:hypothetical protein GCM10022219_08220 [Microbacterium oryzae]